MPFNVLSQGFAPHGCEDYASFIKMFPAVEIVAEFNGSA
jgi:hypothetical protein